MKIVQKNSIMDTDTPKKNAKKKHSDNCSDPGDILQPTWVRRTFCISDALDRIVSGNRWYILLPLGFFLWNLFLDFRKEN
jgi:hypothetical protein